MSSGLRLVPQRGSLSAVESVTVGPETGTVSYVFHCREGMEMEAGVNLKRKNLNRFKVWVYGSDFSNTNTARAKLVVSRKTVFEWDAEVDKVNAARTKARVRLTKERTTTSPATDPDLGDLEVTVTNDKGVASTATIVAILEGPD